jgi:ferrous-iron efflux pump FieF
MESVASRFDNTIAAHGPMMRRAAMAAVITGIVLVAIKTVAYVITDSIAMMASLADSALDVVVSIINLLAVRLALTPADREHRFGHGKAEPLAGLLQGAFIAGSTTLLVTESIKRLITPQPVVHGTVGLVILVFSTVAAFILVLQQRYVVRRTGSIAINADFMHYLADILINIGVFVAILLATSFGWLIADPIMGLLVAAALAWSVVGILRQSWDQLMDRELPDAERERIKAIVLGHRGVFDMHDLRTRAAGVRAFVQLHIEVDPALSLFAAHALSDEVEAEIRTAFPKAEIIIHTDPEGYEQPGPLAKM